MATLVADTARIGPDVELGENVLIEDFCIVGAPMHQADAYGPVKIGDNSIIRSHSVIYQGCDFSGGIKTGHHVLIRENTRAGKNFRIGSFSDIEGSCQFGDYVTCHGYVHVGVGSSIGSFVFIYSLVTLTNDPLPPSHQSMSKPVTLEDGVVVCVGATVMPGAVMRKGSYATAGAMVAGEISIGKVVSPGMGQDIHVKNLCDVETMTRLPWMRNHIGKYPAEEHDRLEKLLAEVIAPVRYLLPISLLLPFL